MNLHANDCCNKPSCQRDFSPEKIVHRLTLCGATVSPTHLSSMCLGERLQIRLILPFCPFFSTWFRSDSTSKCIVRSSERSGLFSSANFVLFGHWICWRLASSDRPSCLRFCDWINYDSCRCEGYSYANQSKKTSRTTMSMRITVREEKHPQSSDALFLGRSWTYGFNKRFKRANSISTQGIPSKDDNAARLRWVIQWDLTLADDRSPLCRQLTC